MAGRADRREQAVRLAQLSPALPAIPTLHAVVRGRGEGTDQDYAALDRLMPHLVCGCSRGYRCSIRARRRLSGSSRCWPRRTSAPSPGWRDGGAGTPPDPRLAGGRALGAEDGEQVVGVAAHQRVDEVEGGVVG